MKQQNVVVDRVRVEHRLFIYYSTSDSSPCMYIQGFIVSSRKTDQYVPTHMKLNHFQSTNRDVYREQRG